MTRLKNNFLLVVIATVTLATFTLSVTQKLTAITANITDSGADSGRQAASLLKEVPESLLLSEHKTQHGPSFKSILAKVPNRVRSDFLQSMIFMHGGLAGAHIGDLESHITPREYGQLLAHLGIKPGDDHKGYMCLAKGDCYRATKHICTNNCYAGGGPTTSFRAVLSSVPEDDRMKFLESLDFVNGRLVNAYVGGIKSHLGKAEYDQLFNSLGVDSNKLRTKIKDDYYRQ